ncbi:MAG: transposon-transfer assisting family protein [Lachnospiraceae bacterium]|nr:transposon-transfer assisting family protein [Lachnospiraceae bacterium]
MYHNADRRRTIGKITAAMPGMDGDMWTLAQQTLSKLKRMTDSDYDSQKFYFTDENALASGVFSFCLFLRI